jgi:hypothetical protein
MTMNIRPYDKKTNVNILGVTLVFSPSGFEPQSFNPIALLKPPYASSI